MKITQLMIGTALTAACATSAWSAGANTRSATTAARLLDLAAASYASKDLSLANLRFSHAQRLAPMAAEASELAQTLEAARAREETCMNEGLNAARVRDLKAVQQSVKCLRDLDAHSSAALEVVLRYQAALADLGGAFPRVGWSQWREGASDTPVSPRHAAPAASRLSQ